jgi:hypothetical protein
MKRARLLLAVALCLPGLVLRGHSRPALALQPGVAQRKSLRQAAPHGSCRLRFEVRPPGQLYSFRVL